MSHKGIKTDSIAFEVPVAKATESPLLAAMLRAEERAERQYSTRRIDTSLRLITSVTTSSKTTYQCNVGVKVPRASNYDQEEELTFNLIPSLPEKLEKDMTLELDNGTKVALGIDKRKYQDALEYTRKTNEIFGLGRGKDDEKCVKQVCLDSRNEVTVDDLVSLLSNPQVSFVITHSSRDWRDSVEHFVSIEYSGRKLSINGEFGHAHIHADTRSGINALALEVLDITNANMPPTTKVTYEKQYYVPRSRKIGAVYDISLGKVVGGVRHILEEREDKKEAEMEKQKEAIRDLMRKSGADQAMRGSTVCYTQINPACVVPSAKEEAAATP